MERFREEISTFGNFPTLFMGIVKEDNGLRSMTASCASWMPRAMWSLTVSIPRNTPTTLAKKSSRGVI